MSQADQQSSVAESARILRQSFRSGKTKTREWRVEQLNAFMRMLREGRDELCDAMYTDLHKHRAEGYFTEVNMLEHECQHMLDHMVSRI
jgi:aldehyde dehydrogenase (NAD+)